VGRLLLVVMVRVLTFHIINDEKMTSHVCLLQVKCSSGEWRKYRRIRVSDLAGRPEVP